MSWPGISRPRNATSVITGTDDITRINLTGTLDFAVTATGSDRAVQSGEGSRPFNPAYSTTGLGPVATAAARRDAEDRLMVALADQLVSRLLSGAPGWV